MSQLHSLSWRAGYDDNPLTQFVSASQLTRLELAAPPKLQLAALSSLAALRCCCIAPPPPGFETGYDFTPVEWLHAPHLPWMTRLTELRLACFDLKWGDVAAVVSAGHWSALRCLTLLNRWQAEGGRLPLARLDHLTRLVVAAPYRRSLPASAAPFLKAMERWRLPALAVLETRDWDDGAYDQRQWHQRLDRVVKGVVAPADGAYIKHVFQPVWEEGEFEYY
jgi:hypothetical protein